MLIQETNSIRMITVPIYYEKHNMYLIYKLKSPVQSFLFTQECPLLKGQEQSWLTNLNLN